MCGFCITFFTWLWEEVIQRVVDWIVSWWRKCSKRKCKKWCLCCNKWLCWLALIFVAIITFILVLILTIIATVICIICFPLCWIVCGLACALNKLFGRPAPQSCLDCWDICTGEQSPNEVVGGGGDGPLSGGGISGGGLSGGGGVAGRTDT